ncbi:MAG: hypothetical protein PUG75_02420 [Prevotella sp.]|nr:hypothetical protein [Prevotella sp.]MDY5258395.1 hypothetical protein [Prevotella sp.]
MPVFQCPPTAQSSNTLTTLNTWGRTLVRPQASYKRMIINVSLKIPTSLNPWGRSFERPQGM